MRSQSNQTTCFDHTRLRSGRV